MTHKDAYCFRCDASLDACECGKRETYSSEAIICPYCGHDTDPADTDGGAYDESRDSWECGSCDKEFQLEVYCSWTWTAKPMEESA